MSSKKQSPPPIGNPTVLPQKGIELVQRQIEEGNKLIAIGLLDKAPYSSWETVTGSYLEKAFGTNSRNVEQFRTLGRYRSFPMNAGERWWAEEPKRAAQPVKIFTHSRAFRLPVSRPPVTSSNRSCLAVIEHKRSASALLQKEA